MPPSGGTFLRDGASRLSKRSGRRRERVLCDVAGRYRPVCHSRRL